MEILRQKLAKAEFELEQNKVEIEQTESKFKQANKTNKYISKQLKETEDKLNKLDKTNVLLEKSLSESIKSKALLEKLLDEFKENFDIATMVRWTRKSERFSKKDIDKIKLLLEQNHIKAEEIKNQDIAEAGDTFNNDLSTNNSSNDELLNNAIDLDGFYESDKVKKKRGRQPNTKTCGRNNTVFEHLKGKEEIEIVVDDKKILSLDKSLKLKFFKKEERKQLDYVKEHLRTRKTVIYYYIDQHSQIYKSKDKNPCIYDFVKGGKVTNRTTAAVAVDKVLFGQPINLQANKLNIFAGAKVVDAQLLNNQFLNAGFFLSPLSELIRKHVVKQDCFRADETTLTVIDHPNSENAKIGYMWGISCKNKKLNAVYFRFDPTRKADVAKDIFEGCGKSAIQADAYSGYVKATREMNMEIAREIAKEEGETLSEEFKVSESFAKMHGLTLVACAAHCRRKFYSLHMAVYKNKPKSAGAVTCAKSLAYFSKIYSIERNTRKELKNNKITEKEFLKKRKDKTTIVLNEFEDFLTKRKSLHSNETKLTDAIKYTLKQYKNLRKYLDYVDLTPCNNAMERDIRSVVKARKTSLFASNVIGAKAWANILTLAQTAIKNDLNPTHYLKYLLDEVTLLQDKSNSEANFERLLPWNVDRKTIDKLWNR